MTTKKPLVDFVKQFITSKDDFNEFEYLLLDYKRYIEGNHKKLKHETIYLDTTTLHSDILSRLNKLEKPQRYLTEKIGISRSLLFRLSKGAKIDFESFLKITAWMGKDMNIYLKNQT